MPANNTEIVYLRGKLHWAKVLGEPVDNYDRNGKEWTFDLELDEDGVRQMKGMKLYGKPVKNIKNKGEFDYISFKQVYRELQPDRNGNPQFTKAPDIMDAAGKPWPQDEKLGNGTVADVKFKVVDYGKGKYPGVYPMAIRILDHVPYKDQAFAPLSEDDPYASKGYSQSKAEDAGFRKDFGVDEDLDDDVPY